MNRKEIDIAFFTWTGNTRKVAEIICREIQSDLTVNLVEIKPKRNFPYLIWLFLSFLPNRGVRIECGESNAPLLVICLPKWTFNCPPITSFLNRVNLKGKTVYVVITYGGFDEKRYARAFKEKIEKLGGKVKEILLIKRNEIQAGNLNWLREWAHHEIII